MDCIYCYKADEMTYKTYGYGYNYIGKRFKCMRHENEDHSDEYYVDYDECKSWRDTYSHAQKNKSNGFSNSDKENISQTINMLRGSADDFINNKQ